VDPLRLKGADRTLWRAAILAAKAAGTLSIARQPEPRPLILRPGGMGDLILCCIAAENLGFSPDDFYWIIERRSRAWADHLGLEYLCYDTELIRRHWQIAGRYQTVINSEQLYGLSQATALLARAPHGAVTCFDSNRGARYGDRVVPYDPDRMHETVAFQRLLAAALDVREADCAVPERIRRSLAREKPVVGIGGLQSVTRAFSEDEWEAYIRSQIGAAHFWIASSGEDRAFAHRLQARFGTRAAVFEGNFDELCRLISQAEEVLTVDSGFLHLASYYGVPSTAIFTSSRASKWSGIARGSRTIRRNDLNCQPCARFAQVPACPHQFACKEIDFEKHARVVSEYAVTGTESNILPVVRSR
jgi:ADP-heptose:LPS heptosyltransferase